MDKPILLLDVDGVLNVIDKTSKMREIRFERAPGQFISFYPIKTTRRLMELAWKRFDVRWLTAWRQGANLIARWAGLEDRPVLIAHSADDWKAEAVRQALDSWQGRLAWIEDGISPEAKEIVAAKGWTYLHCDPFIGATEQHLKDLEEFADQSEMGTPACEAGKKHWFGRWYHASTLSPKGPRRYRKCRRCMNVEWEGDSGKTLIGERMQICGTCGMSGEGEVFSKHRCAEVVKQLRRDLAEKDNEIQAYETRIATMTKMLQDAGVIGKLERDERDQT